MSELGQRIDEANREAAERLMDSQPVLVDISTAAEAIPGMTSRTILHAGPPVRWDRMCGSPAREEQHERGNGAVARQVRDKCYTRFVFIYILV